MLLLRDSNYIICVCAFFKIIIILISFYFKHLNIILEKQTFSLFFRVFNNCYTELRISNM